MFTIDQIKAAIPFDIHAYDTQTRKELTGTVRGAKNPFPQVELSDGRLFGFSWESITRALNTATAIII